MRGRQRLRQPNLPRLLVRRDDIASDHELQVDFFTGTRQLIDDVRVTYVNSQNAVADPDPFDPGHASKRTFRRGFRITNLFEGRHDYTMLMPKRPSTSGM